MCLCLTMEVMLENWMGDIFFFQSVFERLYFSRIHTEYVLMIQVLLFKDNNTIENFLLYNGVCFSLCLSLPYNREAQNLCLCRVIRQ